MALNDLNSLAEAANDNALLSSHNQAQLFAKLGGLTDAVNKLRAVVSGVNNAQIAMIEKVNVLNNITHDSFDMMNNVRKELEKLTAENAEGLAAAGQRGPERPRTERLLTADERWRLGRRVSFHSYPASNLLSVVALLLLLVKYVSHCHYLFLTSFLRETSARLQ